MKNMIIIRKFEITIEIDTEEANTNINKWGDKYDWNGYPNWRYNYAGDELRYIKVCLTELEDNFNFTGLSCKVRALR